MTAEERLAFKLRAYNDEYKRRCAIMRSRVRRAFAFLEKQRARQADNRSLACIAFSGGKDSTVLLDAVLAVVPEIDVCWYDDGWDYPETLAFIDATEKRLGKRILRVAYPPEELWAGLDPDREHPSDLMAKDMDERYFAVFLGLRAGESGRRRWLFERRGYLYWHKTDRQWHCCPLWDWTTEDIWTYIVEHNLPYNAVYDKLAQLGVPLEYRRVGPLTAGVVYRYGAMAVLHRGWQFLYNRFVQCVGEYPTWFS
jgi:phosphoadenosine phosphosulfate reductase